MDINDISSSQSFSQPNKENMSILYPPTFSSLLPNTRDRKLISSPSSYFSILPIFSFLSIFHHFNQMGPSPKEIWDVVEISAYQITAGLLHSLNIFNRQANLYWVSLFSVGLDFDTFEPFFLKKNSLPYLSSSLLIREKKN